MSYYVYILRCADQTLYTGYTGNLKTRLRQHQSGSIPRSYTKPRRPVRLVWAGEFETKDEARARERLIKRWKTDQKEALISQEEAQTELIIEKEGLQER
jgi:predicted GIY-YIG superfamily endonuclease